MAGDRPGGPPQRGGPVKRTTRWNSVQIETMDTMKRASDKKRKEKVQHEKDMFLRKPPTNRQLFQVCCGSSKNASTTLLTLSGSNNHTRR